MRTRSSGSVDGIGRSQDLLRVSLEHRRSGQNALKLLQWLTKPNAFAGLQPEFANGPLVMAAALLDDGDRLLYRARSLEESDIHYGIGQIADVHWRFRGGKQTVL